MDDGPLVVTNWFLFTLQDYNPADRMRQEGDFMVKKEKEPGYSKSCSERGGIRHRHLHEKKGRPQGGQIVFYLLVESKENYLRKIIVIPRKKKR